MCDCNMCGGDLNYLGTVGNLRWWRCEDCGAEMSESVIMSDGAPDTEQALWDLEEEAA